jgi:hypothetical protein
MPEASLPQEDPAFLDLVELFRDLKRGWLWLVVAALLGLAAALIYLNLQTPRYTAMLRVTPAASTQGSLSGTLGRIGSLAAIAGVPMRQGSESATPFELYLDRVRTREIAVELAKDPRLMQTIFETEWDSSSRTWRERPGLLRPVRNLVYGLAGQAPPPWKAPEADRLHEYLQKKVALVAPRPKDPPISSLVYEHKDPAFAVYLLQKLHAQSDADVRAASLARARQYADHLALKLASTDIAEHRRTLSEALLEQERAIMMATAAGPFAAVPTEAPAASRRPTSPQIIPVLALGLALGFVAGLFGLVARHLWKRRTT